MSNLENNKSCGTSSGGGTQTDGYWQDVENKILPKKDLTQEFADDEFDSFSVQKTRRNFLKIMGFSVSALPLTGCIKIPVKKALPYLNKQDNTIPGVANWYASTFDNIPVLIKTREGRPIKVEGNDKSMTTFGGTSALAQASILSLYDSYRYQSALIKGTEVEWDKFDSELKTALEANTGEMVVVTPSISSPSELKALRKFLTKYNASHVAFDAVSVSGFAKANQITNGAYALSEYDFEKANVVVSIGGDFLGNIGNTVSNTKQYTRRRQAKHELGMNKHIQVESIMSLTGSNADYRYTKSEADQRDILLGVLAGITGYGHVVKGENKDIITQIVKELKSNIGKSLLIAGSNDVDAQVIVNKINASLGNYGKTVWVAKKNDEVIGNDESFENLVSRMNSGKVGSVLFVGTNPVYNYHNSEKFISALSKVTNVVSFATSEDETSKISNFVAPMNHRYESWSDTMVSSKELSLSQPVIQPLFGSRMWTETLMSLASVEGTFYDLMKSNWAGRLDWNKVLHDGVVTINENPTVNAFNNGVSVNSYAKNLKATKTGSGLNIVTYVKYGIGNGDMANNPWMQELPDPITKATWDNYAMVSPSYAKEHSIKSGDVVELSNGKHTVKIPAIVQPGTEQNTVAVALGYGHKVGGKVSKNLGGNAYPFVTYNGTFNYAGSFGTVKKTGAFKGLAQTQTHHSMEGRDIIRETTFAEYVNNPKAGNQVPKPKTVHIYPEHKKDGHQWAMAINLSSCTGCSACVISCNAENNVPVVGRKEVANRRDMHWLRIDRYYKGDDNQPEVAHMPMLCQHCDNAPCENVCPVMATVQSSDGLNQQIYNRCVGTRYCANNCPYKVRRFNWFNYDHSDQYEKMVLNPDVSIRSRGIMEKCSMCVQRIQEGKLTAKRDRRELADGDIKLACQQSCPADDGILFGDMNDPTSKISQHLADERKYVVLEELNVQPRVNYLTKIRNK
jgi:Fe-S-cluster-containing dehydrogenase component/anaerobic selenocysteine-containing dehydrogenase